VGIEKENPETPFSLQSVKNAPDFKPFSGSVVIPGSK
jgi:hypothetical protein